MDDYHPDYLESFDKLIKYAQEHPKESMISKSLSINKKTKNALEASLILKVSKLLLAHLQKAYTPEEALLIEVHWTKIFYQALVNCDLSPKSLIYRPKNIPTVVNELDKIIVSIEAKGLSPYDNCELVANEEAKNFVKCLLHDISLKNDPLLWKYLKFLFWKRDPQFIQEVRKELQNVLLVLFHKIRLENHAEDILDMFLGHVLATFALTEPEESDHIQIPRKTTQGWELVDYLIHPIPLTPEWLFHPIYSYGLIPQNNDRAHSLLLFRSTPLPTGKSSLLAMLSDFTPGFSVGEMLYLMGKRNLKKWIKEIYQRNQKTIKVFGQSLGGSMAYLLAMDFPEMVEIHTFVPSGLFKRSMKQDADIKGKSFLHEYDIVGLINHHPTVDTVKVLTENPRKNPLKAHFRLFGCDKTILIRMAPNKHRKRFLRKLFSIGHQIIAVPIFLIKLIIFLPLVFIKVIIEWVKIKRKEPIGF